MRVTFCVVVCCFLVIPLYAARMTGVVVDASAGQAVRRGLHVFAAVENLLNADYDVGRTPIRTIGWPRTVRIGVRVFLP